MKINNNLNVYDDNENLETKVIYKTAIIIFVFLTLICVILTLIFNHLYSIIIGYVVGSVMSFILFKTIEKRIYDTYYEDLGKATKKLHTLHQLGYLLTFLIIALIFKNPYAILATAIGLLLMKMSIFITNIITKKNV